MERGDIISIAIISGAGVSKYSVGIDDVTEIKDRSMEYEDCIHFIYHVISGNNLMAEIVNCPVELRFKENNNE